MSNNKSIEVLFRPNPYNIDPKNIKLGDLFYKSMSGIIFITKIFTEEESSNKMKNSFRNFQGKPLFKFKKLISNDLREYSIYE